MLDIIIPCTKKSLPDLAAVGGDGLISSLKEMTDVKARIIVAVSGVRRLDLGLAEAALEASGLKWAIVETSATAKPMSFMLQEATAHAKDKFVAICKPWVRIDDREWFGKMQVPFIKESRCHIVGTDTSTRATSIAPVRQTKRVFEDLGPLVLIKRSAIADNGFSKIEGESWAEEFAAAAIKKGGTVWVAPGVRLA